MIYPNFSLRFCFSIFSWGCYARQDIQDLFGNPNDFKDKGGNKAMGDSLDRGHVATFSLWDDIDVNMMWLDSCYPTDESCPVCAGACAQVEKTAHQSWCVRNTHQPM